MIKLSFFSECIPPNTRYFDQSSVIIGGEQSLHADLKFPGSSLQEKHVQIIKQIDGSQTSFVIINLANDPFVTLNNLPFGKQPIYAHDVIQIGDISIRFEYEKESSLSDKKNTADSSNHKLLEKPTPKTSPLTPAGPFTSSLASSEDKISVGFQKTPKLSLKDYYLSEYDDHEDVPETIINAQSQHRPALPLELAKTWGTFLSFIAGVFGILAAVIGILYLWLNDQTGEDEAKAAKAVADISMALTYAQLKNIHPQNQNWAYPDFIKSNLLTILAPHYVPLADIDAQGQFANSPYILRIYTSSDLAQFLVIAQPSPSILQWFIPKASIIVDSQVMEMRKIKDLKPLNRLLVSASNLEHNHAIEISNLVKQGELIPLSSLVNKAENQGLAPPKALGLMRPGAENFVYNAPRYYLFGKSFLDNALSLIEGAKGAQEMNVLQYELSFLHKFPDFIFYSSDSIPRTLQAQKALASLIPHEVFLMAHLQFNRHGKIAKAHLLMDNARSDVALQDTPRQERNEAAEEPSLIKDDVFIVDESYPPFFEEYFLKLKQDLQVTEASNAQILETLKLIEESKSWQELEENVFHLNPLLQLDHMPETDRLVVWRNAARFLVIQKLNQFAKTPPSDIQKFNFQESLSQVLKASWITDPSMHDFYIAEFEGRPLKSS